MKGFKSFYLWALNAKLYMGLYFMAIAILVSAINFCLGSDSLGFFTLLQIMGVSIFTALAQVFILPDSTDFSKRIIFPRSLIWLILSGGVIGAVAHFGNWFYDLPNMISWVFAAVMVIGCSMMLIAFQFEQQRDTKALNESLNNFKNKLQD